MTDISKYRPGVGMMILNADKKVFVGKRKDDIRFLFKPSQGATAWQMPQGGIDDNESAEKAVLRELQEEVGTNAVKLIATSGGWYSYELPAEVVHQLWNGQYIGQRQKWFLFQFLGNDSDININTTVPEFTEWKWVEIEELPQLIVTFKRQLYLDLITEFRPFINSI